MAARSINKAQIMGNLTADPVMRTTTNGTPVATFAVATNRSYTDSQGEQQESAEFHNIVAFGKLAELCVSLLKLGSKVLVEGRLQTRKWDDESGKTNYKTEIVINEMYLLANGKRSDDYDGGNYSDDNSSDEQNSSSSKSEQKKSDTKEEKKDKDEDIDLDEIPF